MNNLVQVFTPSDRVAFINNKEIPLSDVGLDSIKKDVNYTEDGNLSIGFKFRDDDGTIEIRPVFEIYPSEKQLIITKKSGKYETISPYRESDLIWLSGKI